MSVRGLIFVLTVSLLSFAAHAKVATKCRPPEKFVKEIVHQDESDVLDSHIMKGQWGGIAGEWTAVIIKRPHQLKQTKTSKERADLIETLKIKRRFLDPIIGRDEHEITHLDIFKNGVESTGTYYDQEAETHYYANWEFGIGDTTCVLEFEADEAFTADSKETIELRKWIAGSSG